MKCCEPVFESLKGWGDHPVCIELGPDGSAASLSAPDFLQRINDVKAMLVKEGIGEHDIVSVFLENSSDYAAVFLALIDMGAKPVPVNLAFRKIELDEIFSNAEPCAIITEAGHSTVVQPYAQGRIVIERQGGKWLCRRPGGTKKKGVAGDLDNDIASINYTYRGYGYPLGALVPHRQYITGAMVLQEGIRLNRGENILIVLPMVNIFTLIGCLFHPLIHGVTMIIAHRKNPLRLLEYIGRHRVDNVLAVPELFDLLVKFRDGAGDVSSLKAFLSGGSVLPVEQYDALGRLFNVDLIHGYGLTEFTPVSRNIRGSIRPGSIGTVSRGVECRIDSPDSDGTGEIWIKTDHMTKAYHRRPDETAEAFADGWFKTGDTGRLEEGHLVFAGEKKKTRKVKGNMVDLEEVRRALVSVPGVHDAAVSVEDNTVSAVIERETCTGGIDDIPGIKQHLEGMIAAYKIPKTVRFS
ncbi:MAG TPA: class I adenylate-forming enzyme family protein [Spirochaetota bacterium]|nr:class I adenylate-forming enzyme family protein [Spirochaetota bacterium]HQJ71250.1 class I adenylate-forming enzyme family protein [Spirochaetota bacterium]HRS77618.1 class I adenylate-forming enzyme family protein [Spirochaetota bacterium]HRT75679.1 class I adenylate-forming enzyme family protein [Spirochaetota bacterium]